MSDTANKSADMPVTPRIKKMWEPFATATAINIFEVVNLGKDRCHPLFLSSLPKIKNKDFN